METATIDTPPEAASFQAAADASAAVDAARVETLRTYEEMLPCVLTDAEILARATSLADLHADIDDVESEIAAAKAAHKATMDRLGGDRDDKIAFASQVAREIRERKAEKLVACRDEKVFATGVVRSVRVDTGETFDERPMDGSERQADLFGAGAAAEPNEVHSSALVDDPDDTEPPAKPEGITLMGKVVSASLPFSVILGVGSLHTAVSFGEGCVVPAFLAEGDEIEVVGDHDEVGTFVAKAVTKLETPVTLDPDKLACAACGEPGCTKTREQCECGGFVHAGQTCPACGVTAMEAPEEPKKRRGRRG